MVLQGTVTPWPGVCHGALINVKKGGKPDLSAKSLSLISCSTSQVMKATVLTENFAFPPFFMPIGTIQWTPALSQEGAAPLFSFHFSPFIIFVKLNV